MLAPSLASAHIRVTSPPSRDQVNIKSRHCGVTGSARAHVYTALPGSTLHVVWDEFVPHPGYFRVSFNQNGDTFRIPPVPAGGGYPTENLTGMMDPGGSGSLIIADQIAHPALSLDVTLPDVECASCTLQVIQMMTDKPPYTIDTGSNDIYFQCVDLVLTRSAPMIDAGTVNPGDPDAGQTGNSEVSGGCSAGRGGGGSLAAAGLALAATLRFRRRR